MQIDMFDESHQKNSLNIDLKKLMIAKIADEILSESSYREYLLTTPSKYKKILSLIDSAISYFESEEIYEKCNDLMNFKKDILNKTCNL